MYSLKWIKKENWIDKGGYTCCTKHDSIEEIISIMSKCIYNGEWIEDSKGNKLDINLRNICVQ